MMADGKKYRISTKNFQIFPFGMLATYYIFIKDSEFINSNLKTNIATGMAILSLVSLYIVLRRQYKEGQIKKVKQKLLSFSLFICISTGAFMYYHFFVN